MRDRTSHRQLMTRWKTIGDHRTEKNSKGFWMIAKLHFEIPLGSGSWFRLDREKFMSKEDDDVRRL